jgi:hypothetical protein
MHFTVLLEISHFIQCLPQEMHSPFNNNT